MEFGLILIAFVQGIIEWLPISSSTHIKILESLFNYKSDIFFGVSLHFGTLMACFVYFGRDIIDILRELISFNFKSKNGRLGILLIVASLPIAILGFLFNHFFSGREAGWFITAFGLVITSLLLFSASFYKAKRKVGLYELKYGKSFFIGVLQALSVVPGISRSGSSISGGIFSDFNERDAFKFSFLLSIPAIFGANLLLIGNNPIPSEYFLPSFVSFLTGLLGIHLSYNYIMNSRKNYRIFGVYTLLLAILIFAFGVF